MLKKLVIIRHGEASSNGYLKTEGVEQINKLAEILYINLINFSSFIFFSATSLRAEETSEIIRKKFKLNSFEEYDFLYSGIDTKENLQKTKELISKNSETHEVIFISSHLEFQKYFPSIWGEDKGFEIERKELKRGSAIIIDAETGSVEYLPK